MHNYAIFCDGVLNKCTPNNISIGASNYRASNNGASKVDASIDVFSYNRATNNRAYDNRESNIDTSNDEASIDGIPNNDASN